MSQIPASPVQQDGRPISASGVFPMSFLVLIAVCYWFVATFKLIVELWNSGFYLDPDDAMRMAQVHDWMNGQGWWDLMSYRLNAPDGVYMHWTRLVDVPIGLLIWFFRFFTDPEGADRLARLVFPLLLFIGLLIALMQIGKKLIGPRAPMIVAILLMFSGIYYGYFSPGRLDHDHVSILLMMLWIGAICSALDPTHRRTAFWGGIIIAFALAVSLETLPFDLIGIAALPVAWIAFGDRYRWNVQNFFIGISLGLILGFFTVVGPGHYFDRVNDSLALAHVLGGVLGSVLAIIIIWVGRKAVFWQRLGLALVITIMVAGFEHHYFPEVLAAPYQDMNPLLRTYWLENVSEAKPLLEALKTSTSLLGMVIPILLGLACAIWASFVEKDVVRRCWIAVAFLLIAGFATSMWEVRALGETLPIALLPLAWGVSRLAGPAYTQNKAYAVPLTFLLCAVISPLVLTPFFPDENDKPEKKEQDAIQTICRRAAAFAPLKDLPQGLVATPVDSGAHFLARTSLGVLSAPFHRNTEGNLTALKIFMADPAAAEPMVRDRGIKYIAFCPKINDIENYHVMSPNGLASQLDDGKVPVWLKKLDLPSPYYVFEVQPK